MAIPSIIRNGDSSEVPSAGTTRLYFAVLRQDRQVVPIQQESVNRMTDSSAILNQKFGIHGFRFDRTSGGLDRAVIQTDVAQGEICLQGAHVTQYQPAGQSPVLWMSASSWLEPGKPIRGGVPICFPWFGPHPTDTSAPGHGSARLMPWEVKASGRMSDGGVWLELTCDIAPFQVSFRCGFGEQLTMELLVELPTTAAAPARFEEALHTYFSVSDIRQVRVTGLEQTDFVDTVGGRTDHKATGLPVSFSAETDLVFQGYSGPCEIHDPRGKRTIRIDRLNSESTVVWNPWIAKSVRMPDFGDHEWPGMLCVETANIQGNAVVLSPGQLHFHRTVISSNPAE